MDQLDGLELAGMVHTSEARGLNILMFERPKDGLGLSGK